MCGIFGVHNHREATSTILQGLKQLEYRGYDSAGLAVVGQEDILTCRAQGKIINLEKVVNINGLRGVSGIGHTRWATHGAATQDNAHPHRYKDVVVVHNGIIENHHVLRQKLMAKGHQFLSQTDSEVIPHMIQQYLDLGYLERDAIAATMDQLEGSYALGILVKTTPDIIYAVKNASPLAIGKAADQLFLASDALALSKFAEQVFYPEDGQLVTLSQKGTEITHVDGQQMSVSFCDLNADDINISRGNYEHFMLKEIHEQPSVVKRILQQPMPAGSINVDEINRLHIIACGTSFYAANVAKYWFETICRIPVNVDIASEFRYRDTPFFEGDTALFISQSGETADTLAALKHAKGKGLPVMSLVNVATSSMARESDFTWLTHAGPEIGVASTKALMSQLVQLLRLCLVWGLARDTISRESYNANCQTLERLPELISEQLNHNKNLEDFIAILQNASSALFLGRAHLSPVAMEGALKLKEISYIHAEGYAFGELKHGPIALIDDELPIVAMIDDVLTEKAISNLREVSARGGKTCLIASKEVLEMMKDDISIGIEMPKVNQILSPMLYMLPLQLLAYYTALAKGNDVDQPRNLAKSVTVE